MKRTTTITLILTMTLLLAVSTALAGGNNFWFAMAEAGGRISGDDYVLSGPVNRPDVGKMSGGEYTLQAGLLSPIEPAATSGKIWRSGFTTAGGAAYNSTSGRMVSTVAAFHSNQDVADIYYIFPATAGQATVQTAKFYILDRTGSYVAGDATLTLEIFNYAGALQHTVSATAVDLEAAPTGAWTALTLSGVAANLKILPGEFLAFHFNLSEGATGNLDVRPMFEVEVLIESRTGDQVYLPLILKN